MRKHLGLPSLAALDAPMRIPRALASLLRAIAPPSLLDSSTTTTGRFFRAGRKRGVAGAQLHHAGAAPELLDGEVAVYLGDHDVFVGGRESAVKCIVPASELTRHSQPSRPHKSRNLQGQSSSHQVSRILVQRLARRR